MARFSELRTMVNTRLSAPVVQALLAGGANAAPQARKDNGETPLSIALSGGHLDVVRALRAAGAGGARGGKDNDGMLLTVSCTIIAILAALAFNTYVTKPRRAAVPLLAAESSGGKAKAKAKAKQKQKQKQRLGKAAQPRRGRAPPPPPSPPPAQNKKQRRDARRAEHAEEVEAERDASEQQRRLLRDLVVCRRQSRFGIERSYHRL